jgi:hypothetical protein
MCLLLILFWCSAVVRRCGGPTILGENSWFGEFNSRLGRREFPFALLREFAHKGLIYRAVFAAKRRVLGKIDEIPGLSGKTGNLPHRPNGPWRSPDGQHQHPDRGLDRRPRHRDGAPQPKPGKGLSEKILVSHYENNYTGAANRLDAITAQLAGLDYASAPGFLVNGLKREELIAANSMILHELYFAGLGDESRPGAALAR